MKLPYDPADGELFWAAISKIPGYPQDERMPIRKMIFEPGAFYKTSQVLAEMGADRSQPLLLVMDTTPMKRGGGDLKTMMISMLNEDGWRVKTVLLEPDGSGQVHTDMAHIDQVKLSLSPRSAVLSMGSGVVTDIAKHGCTLFEKGSKYRNPFVIYQTANSVSAYTSNMAPVFIDGVKRTLPSRYPDALICDLETLRDAPQEMTVAGVGDMLAVFVSLPDWYLANQLGLDPGYVPLPKELMGALDDIFFAEAEGIRTGSMESMAVLAKAIALGGLAMSLSHATTPLSGYEHVMSHILDMQAEVSGSCLAQHGTQVALATIIVTGVYRQVLDTFSPDKVNLEASYPDENLMKRLIETRFSMIDPGGKVGKECWTDYQQKLSAWQDHRKEFKSVLHNWEDFRAKIENEIRPAEKLIEILRAIGSPLTWGEIDPPMEEERVKFAFMNAPFMRKRFTIGDLLIFLNWDREALWERVWQCSQKPGNILGVEG
jgi:glycerol-1-phosphate dehydrogenase [NAD(P)+]